VTSKAFHVTNKLIKSDEVCTRYANLMTLTFDL